MKKNNKYFFSVLLVLLFSTSIIAQVIIDERTYNEFIRLNNERSIGNNVLTEKDIEGSPYLNQEFMLGSLLTTVNILYKDIPLRYNIYNDNIEYNTGDGACLAISNPLTMKEIRIGDKRFLCTNKHNKKGEQFGYYELLNDGNVLLLKQYNLIFIDRVDPAPYRTAEPPKFKRNADTYYFKLSGSEPQQFSKKKDFESIFGEKSSLILDFMKKQKIKLNEETDLVKLATFINTI